MYGTGSSKTIHDLEDLPITEIHNAVSDLTDFGAASNSASASLLTLCLILDRATEDMRGIVLDKIAEAIYVYSEAGHEQISKFVAAVEAPLNATLPRGDEEEDAEAPAADTRRWRNS